MIAILDILFRLLIGHALADFALQNDFMARNKNRHAEPAGYDRKLHGKKQKVWPYVLTAHSLIHGGMVYLITGSLALGLLETAVHWAIDFRKCERWYGIHTDQYFHIIAKINWAIIAVTW